eukprot:SAG11_NODE_7288_length_1166_cov_1.088097_2_plen_102_part_00
MGHESRLDFMIVLPCGAINGDEFDLALLLPVLAYQRKMITGSRVVLRHAHSTSAAASALSTVRGFNHASVSCSKSSSLDFSAAVSERDLLEVRPEAPTAMV